jgi:hypothetical protein
MVDDTFNSGAFMDDVPVDFIKGMEGIDTIPGPEVERAADRSAGEQVELRPAIAEDVRWHAPAGHGRHGSVPR